MRSVKFVVVLIAIFAASIANAVEFLPPVVTITGEPVELWEGGETIITFDLGGRDCMIYLAVYTKGVNVEWNNSSSLLSGMPYHWVAGVDTLLYVSTGEGFTVGNDRAITWTGKDLIGNDVPAGELTYYLLALDEGHTGSAPIPTGEIAHGNWLGDPFVQYDLDDGTVLDKPRVWDIFKYTELGQDTEAIEFVEFEPPAVFVASNRKGVHTTVDPDDNSLYYFNAYDQDSEMHFTGKCVLNPDAPAAMVAEFAVDGLYWFESEISLPWTTGAPMKDGIIALGAAIVSDPWAYVHIVDAYTGEQVRLFDFYEWFVRLDWEEELPYSEWVAMTSGPGKLHFSPNNPNKVWNCETNMGRTNICFDPTKETDNLYWVNKPNDYHGPDAQAYVTVWRSYSLQLDDYDFVHYLTNLWGVNKSQILGPDGSQIANFASLGQIAGNNRHYNMVIIGGTAYDGMYSRTTTETESYTGWQGYDVFQGVITSGVGVEDETPAAYSLSNAPDPFNPATTISYSMSNAGQVSLEVFNVLGQKVATLFDGQRDAGSYSVRWDASGFSDGIYFAVMKTEGFTKTEKMMLLK